MSEGLGPLNLADADLTGFDAVDTNRYNAEVFEVTMGAVSKEGGKMPKGTPIVKVQFRLVDDDVENRRVFTQFTIPPKSYDKTKAAKMKGMYARFLIAVGEPEDKVLSKDYETDFEDLKGRACVVSVVKEPKKTYDENGDLVTIPDEYSNRVTGIKPAGTLVASEGSGLL